MAIFKNHYWVYVFNSSRSRNPQGVQALLGGTCAKNPPCSNGLTWNKRVRLMDSLSVVTASNPAQSRSYFTNDNTIDHSCSSPYKTVWCSVGFLKNSHACQYIQLREKVKDEETLRGISGGWQRGNCMSGTLETTSWLGWESAPNPSSNHSAEAQALSASLASLWRRFCFSHGRKKLRPTNRFR